MRPSSEIYAISRAAIAEDDGRSWAWQGPCLRCGSVHRAQSRDVTATLVSEPALVVRTDSGLVLAAPSLITLATKRTLDLPTRPANLLDNYGERLEGFVQLVGAETLKVISAERNECGCVSRVDWDPLVVAPPLNLATVYAIDSNPGAVLVSGELAAHLRGTDARIKLALVYF